MDLVKDAIRKRKGPLEIVAKFMGMTTRTFPNPAEVTEAANARLTENLFYLLCIF